MERTGERWQHQGAAQHPSPTQRLARVTGTNYCHHLSAFNLHPSLWRATPCGVWVWFIHVSSLRRHQQGRDCVASLLQPMPHPPGAPTSHSVVSISAIEGSHCLGRRQTSLCLHLSPHPAYHRLLREYHMISFIFSLSPGHLA